MNITLGPTQFVLLLHSIPELGEKSLTQLFTTIAQQRISPSSWLSLNAVDWQRMYGLKHSVTDYISQNRALLLTSSEEALRDLQKHPVEVLTLNSSAYPSRIEQYDDAPPPILYALGNRTLLHPAPMRFTFTIAVSNDPPPEVLEAQDRIASDLIELGGVPVTGHDRLPYQRLALTAQRRNRPVLYVLDRGLREALSAGFDRPLFAAARIREGDFQSERDCVVSPFRLDDHAIGANNRRRDSLVFAFSDVIVALYIRPGGNMAKELLRALKRTRPVYLIADHMKPDSTFITAGGKFISWNSSVAESIADNL